MRRKLRELRRIFLLCCGFFYMWWYFTVLEEGLSLFWLVLPIAVPGIVYIMWRFRRQILRNIGRLLRRGIRALRRKRSFRNVDLDNIAWDDFEDLIAHLFRTRGFKTRTTKRSGDQGIDVIAENKNLRIGIQCKRYTGAVGNDAVMAAIAGSKYYRCNRTLVVCTSTFTKAAVDLADATGVQLWDRERLERELNWI